MMDFATLQERFIEAADTDRLRRIAWKPKKPGTAMPTYRYSYADKQGWRKEHGDKLKPEDWDKERRLQRESEDDRVPTAVEISRLEECERWVIAWVASENERRALWHWARTKVSSASFRAWCAKEGIHENTGADRKNRAIEAILVGINGRTLQHNVFGDLGGVDAPPDLGHVSDRAEEGVSGETQRFTWRQDPSLRPANDPENRDMKWAAKQSRLRREAAERRRREAEAAAEDQARRMAERKAG